VSVVQKCLGTSTILVRFDDKFNEMSLQKLKAFENDGRFFLIFVYCIHFGNFHIFVVMNLK